MIFPYRSLNSTRTVPFITILLILINIGIFLLQLSSAARGVSLASYFALVPQELPLIFISLDTIWIKPLYNLVSYAFLHGGFLHLGSNMLYLWIFGNNVEDELGHFRFLIYYLLLATSGGLAHTAFNLNSPVPMIGASGAVAGILGSYFYLYPKARVNCVIFLGFFFTTKALPAALVLGFWILLQIINALLTIGHNLPTSTAWMAHIGGFFGGLYLIRSWAPPRNRKS